MADLTTKQLAIRFDVHITTIRLWIKNGLFPGAREEQTPRGPVWLIPETDLEGFTPPPMGRPKKETTKVVEEEQIATTPPKPIKKTRRK